MHAYRSIIDRGVMLWRLLMKDPLKGSKDPWNIVSIIGIHICNVVIQIAGLIRPLGYWSRLLLMQIFFKLPPNRAMRQGHQNNQPSLDTICPCKAGSKRMRMHEQSRRIISLFHSLVALIMKVCKYTLVIIYTRD